MSTDALFRLGIVSESLNTSQGEDFTGPLRAGWRAPYPVRRKYPIALQRGSGNVRAAVLVRRIQLCANRLLHHAKRRLQGVSSSDSHPTRTPI